MNRSHVIVVASIVAALTAGCGEAQARCVEASGPRVTQARSVGAFRSVQITGAIDLELTQSKTTAVEIDAPQDVIDRIETTVDDGVLIIGTRDCLRAKSPIKARVSAPRIEGFAISGSGDARLSKIAGKLLRIEIAGSGDVDLDARVSRLEIGIRGSGDVTARGSAKTQAIAIHGSGDVDTSRVGSDSASVQVYGSGDVSVSVRNEIDATVHGSGDVQYSGSPTSVRRVVHGSGRIVAR